MNAYQVTLKMFHENPFTPIHAKEVLNILLSMDIEEAVYYVEIFKEIIYLRKKILENCSGGLVKALNDSRTLEILSQINNDELLAEAKKRGITT